MQVRYARAHAAKHADVIAAGGVSFLVIEHNMDLVMSVCDPIIVMAQGKVIYRGDAAGVRRDQAVVDAYLGDLPE